MATKIAHKDLVRAVDDLSYSPDKLTRQLKASFWVRFNATPLASKDKITLAAVMNLVDDSSIQKSWAIPGFKEWFLNKETWRERQEYLVHLAQATAEQILLDPEAAASAKVALIKYLGDTTGRGAVAKQEVFVDKDIQKMDADQLKELLESAGLLGGKDDSDKEERGLDNGEGH